MLTYLRAKVSEYEILLSWIAGEIQRLQATASHHTRLFSYLAAKLVDAQSLHNQLRVLVTVGHPRLLARGLPLVHELEYSTAITSYYYLPALQREGQADLLLRKLLLSVAARCGLSWVEDVAVRLDGSHATVSVITEAPVLFLPPSHLISLVDMPGIYHELGHNASQRFPDMMKAILTEVVLYYDDVRQSAGPLRPDQRAERDRAIQRAQNYWHRKRLEELFCDVFGTFLCGPAHHVSCIDMGIRLSTNPFEIDQEDVHPPLAARVLGSEASLLPLHRTHSVIAESTRRWTDYLGQYTRDPDYDLTCSDRLIQRLAGVMLSQIQACMPNAKRYDRHLPNTANTQPDSLSTTETLETVLNSAVLLLYTKPNEYMAWDRQAIKDALIV